MLLVKQVFTFLVCLKGTERGATGKRFDALIPAEPHPCLRRELPYPSCRLEPGLCFLDNPVIRLRALVAFWSCPEPRARAVHTCELPRQESSPAGVFLEFCR